MEVAVAGWVDAAGVRGEIPGADEEDSDGSEGPEEKLYGQSGDEGLVEGVLAGAGGPGEEKSAEEADTGSEGEAKDGEGEAVLPLGAGHKKGGHCDPVERRNAEGERESPGEIEKHGAPSQDDCKTKRGGYKRNACMALDPATGPAGAADRLDQRRRAGGRANQTFVRGGGVPLPGESASESIGKMHLHVARLSGGQPMQRGHCGQGTLLYDLYQSKALDLVVADSEKRQGIAVASRGAWLAISRHAEDARAEYERARAEYIEHVVQCTVCEWEELASTYLDRIDHAGCEAKADSMSAERP